MAKKSLKREVLIEKLHRIKEARNKKDSHPVYPGLEYAKLHKAQYKLVHIVNKFYYRMKATGTKVEFCKGVMHEDQVITLSEWSNLFSTRADAYIEIQKQISKLLLEGYTWEGRFTTAEEIHATQEFQNMLDNKQAVNFEAANDKYKLFEDTLS